MKRFITILLALSMVISLLPATFAANTTADSGITVTYNIVSYGAASGVELVSFTDYNQTNGFWKYFGRYKDAGSDNYMKIYLDGGSSKWKDRLDLASYGGTDANHYVALKINVPKSGKYAVTQYYGTGASGTDNAAMYILPGDTLSGSIVASLNDSNKIVSFNCYDTTSRGATKTSSGTYDFEAGEYLVVYRNLNMSTSDIYVGNIILNGGTNSVPMIHTVTVEDEDATIAKAETTQINVAAYDSKSNAAVTSGFTYTSSNEKIATVDETGLVTGVGMGKATITVTATNETVAYTDSETIDITVTSPDASGVKVEYDMLSPGKATNIGDVTYEKTTGLWKYAYSSNGTNYKSVNANDCLSLEAYGGAGGYVAITINVPVKGDYNLTFEHLKYKSGTTQGAMYIAPANVPLADVVNDTKYLITDKINYNETDTSKIYINSIDLGPISFENAGEYNVVYKGLVDGNTMYPGDLILNGGTGAAYVGTVTATDTELEVGDSITPTVAVYNSSTGAEITSGVTLTSSNTDVAKIIDGTTVKAVGAGKATISATCTDPAVGNVIGTEITVTVPENTEYVAAFNPDSTGSETVNEVVSPLVYAKDGTKLNITPSATQNVNGTWLVSTDAESGDYKFLYWAKGLSTGVKRRIVSRSASFNYDAENEGNYLIAVYEKEGMKTSGDEYYNANGQLLEDDTLPYLAGYNGAATGWEARGDGMHVAIFPEENRATYTITVDGKEDTYHYGDPVVCTADAEKDGKKFFGWRKTVNNAPAELVSASTSYTFKAWETCKVTAVYEDEKPVFSGVARKIVLGTFNVGNETAIMAEFIGFGNDVVERGISLNGTEIAMTTKEYNQFTLVAESATENISGYAILADGTKVIYNK